MTGHTEIEERNLRGRGLLPGRNSYCFVFRFDEEGRIAYLTEHWNTWHAHRVLMDNYDVGPATP